MQECPNTRDNLTQPNVTGHDDTIDSNDDDYHDGGEDILFIPMVGHH